AQKNKAQNSLLPFGAPVGLQPPDRNSANGEEEDKDPQEELQKSGEIPNDFLRQMFYTLADYKDILFSGDKDKKNGYNDIITGDKEMEQRESKIKEAIQEFFEQNSNKASVPPVKPSDKDPKSWWNDNAKHIWDGMVCALQYDSNDKTIKIHKEVLDKLNNNNKYDKQKSKMEEITCRPQFIRWFEEWAEEFCRKKTHKLAQIKDDCRGASGHNYCDGDGFDCKNIVPNKDEILKDFNCPSCAKSCNSYKQWINIKRSEFDKQKKIYDKEIHNYESNTDNIYHKFFETRDQNYKSFDLFLKKLNEGPYCKVNTGDSKIDFKNTKETFAHAKKCAPCPIFGVNCKRDDCNDAEEKTFKNKNVVGTNDIQSNKDSIKEFLIHVSDKRENIVPKDLEICKDKNIFEGIREKQWTCGHLDNSDICVLENFKEAIDDKQNILFRTLFKGWLENFVKDYNKIKNKISHCLINGQGFICINGCNKNCECVQKWIDQKKGEWTKVRDRYLEPYELTESEKVYEVTRFLGSFEPQTEINKAIKPCKNLNQLQDSKECTDSTPSGNKDSTKKDVIEILIDNLQEKISECKKQHNKSLQNCVEPSILETPSPTLEENDPLDDYYIQQPKICPPPEPPLSCVEIVAEKLRKEAEENAKKYDSTLIGVGKNFNGECNKVIKENGVKGDDLCKLDKTYEKSMGFLKQTCNNNGKERFNIGNIWNCKYINKIRKDICIPPRREHMCLDDLNKLWRSTVNDSSDLLKKVQEAAKREGDDIIRTLLPINVCNENVICDAMKYSFADLGDIIRGKDLWNKNNKQKGIQKKIENTFENIYIKLERDKSKYDKDRPKFFKLRSDWWDANRRDIWKAMTCNAPDDAKLLKKNEIGNNTTSSKVNCGHNTEPPDYDYIPQPFRWMQEWSESFCKLLNEQIKKFETECEDCKKNNNQCTQNGENCTKCKNQCKKYKELLEKWKYQMDKHSDTYKHIYDEISEISSENYVKKFLEKLKSKCQDPKTVDEYLDKSNNCINFTFRKDDQNDTKYAFKETPNDYVNACNCDPTDILHECPFKNGNQDACKSISTENICKKKNFDNDLDDWNSGDIPESTSKNNGVLVPPRRRQLCVKNMTTMLSSIVKKNDFKIKLLQSAYNEGKLLGEMYDKNKEKALQAMKYSFADYGDIIKGTDIMENYNLIKLKNKLDVLLKQNKANEISKDREKWWTENRTRVWNAMLCGYKFAGGNLEDADCSLPDDNTHQFLRWFQEWSEHFCTRRNQLYEQFEKQCSSAKCSNGTIYPNECKKLCETYRNFISTKKNQYDLQIYQYNRNHKNSQLNRKEVPGFIKNKCDSNCNCLSENFSDEKKWKNPYESFDNVEYKEKCVCIKTEFTSHEVERKDPPGKKDKDTPPPLKPDIQPKSDELPIPADEPFNRDILEKTIPFGIAVALGSIAFLFLKVKDIYLLCLDIYLCICMCFIYIVPNVLPTSI
ncbi:hypothetical protein PFFCH_03799, partial [Plasmodium falciparum FCH/4]